jgi:hypothetical protein
VRLPRSLAIGCLLLLSSACRDADPPPAADSPSDQQASQSSTSPADTTTLVSIPTGAGRNELLRAALGDCIADACPIEVRLLQDNRVTDVVRLEWTAMSREVASASTDFAIGPVDPLRVEQQLNVWSVGAAEQAVLVGTRSVQLPGRTGLLIDQVVGFDHVTRRHELYAAFDGKVVNLWSSIQPQGPYWSAVSILPGPAAAADTLIRILAFEADAARAATVTAEAFAFDDAQRAMRSTGQPVKLSSARLGPYATVEAARRERASSKCLVGFWIMDAAQLGDKAARNVLLVAFGVDQAAAQAMLDQAVQCAPQVKALGIESVTLTTGD